jgi:protein-L-isoaspartate(D-aspartate) O-methyltransferase
MVATQISRRGVRDPRVLAAMRAVPREEFIRADLAEFAYEDTPLPIEEGQTISQPYIVALMAEAGELQPSDRVLEIGTGSGYAAAVLAEIVDRVYSIERHEPLARSAAERLSHLGYENVRVFCGDGTMGWPEEAPFDAIIVAAGGPEVPEALRQQLSMGGRLVIPVGEDPRTQELVRVRRTDEQAYRMETLGQVQFVPLIGSAGWAADGGNVTPHRPTRPLRLVEPKERCMSELVREGAEPLMDDVGEDLGALLERIGDARVVLIGEGTHGTSEFYRMRSWITEELIRKKGFDVVAIEGDWPDTTTFDRYVRGERATALRTPAFSRFPTWMWRNEEIRAFIEWLASHNEETAPDEPKVGMYGLDLYSLNNSLGVVLEYLEGVDPEAAAAARVRYGCLTPWETDPAVYGRAAAGGRLATCEDDVVQVLSELLAQRLEYIHFDGDAFFDAEQNARVVRDAERYYRVMYYGSRDSWNLRDTHMFEVLRAVLDHRGEGSRAVVWAHNSHVGNAAATEMGVRGEINVGQLVKETYGEQSYSIGFGTDHGTVAAATNWGEPVQFPYVRPARRDSYEHLCHRTGIPGFLLPLRAPPKAQIREGLLEPHLERAIGVIYRPESELVSHYFQAALPAQFDEYIWFDETHAVRPLQVHELAGMPETYPFGL